MADVVSKEVRSRMMSGIRSKNTKAEVFIRKRLHAGGFRYKLHDKRLPGRPDIVLPRHRAVIFVHGCFWHGHGCHLFKQPKSRTKFWVEKIDTNKRRDASAYQLLREKGWRIAEIWECALKGKTRLRSDAVIQSLAEWIKSNTELLSVTGE